MKPENADGGPRARQVALIGYPGVQSLDLIGPWEVFAMANRFSGQRLYDITLAAPEAGPIHSNSGLPLGSAVAVGDLPSGLDTILVGGGSPDGLNEVCRSSVPAWLSARSSDTRRVGSVCSGAFVLAAAGLLAGRRATSHWEVCDQLQSQCPDARIEPDAIYVADPPIYTSAGVTAGIDLCLALVEADCGPDLALAVARNLVLFMRRPGGQTQYSAGLNVQAAATPKLRQLTADVLADPALSFTLPELADRAGMSERTFSRAFVKETGVTPASFVEAARVDRAKAFLETSDWPLARVAERSGFGSLDALHRAFSKRVKATPGDYRARFGRRVGAPLGQGAPSTTS
jgi:transcriptional regulator GlxA family with amidase domain